jgi:uncharacterized peroxidase-related enzyme
VAHAEFLRAESGNDLAAEQIKYDWRQMGLSEAERAMLEYAEKLTVAPRSMSQKDVQRLRDVGWTDRDILDICQVAAYFNYRVRIADGLGVELDDRLYRDASEGRRRAQEQARQFGKEVPPDIWESSGTKKQV